VSDILFHTYITVKLITYSVIISDICTATKTHTLLHHRSIMVGCSIFLSSAVGGQIWDFRGRNMQMSCVHSLACSCWAFQCVWRWFMLFVTHCQMQQVGHARIASGARFSSHTLYITV